MTAPSKYRENRKGFTLIELLIVIAIIGVLAATVVVSLGSQSDNATKGSVKLGVSSLRTVATIHALEGKTGQALCNEIYKNVSGEKTDWEWTGSRQCTNGDLVDTGGLTSSTNAQRASSEDAVAGELCCYADGDKWVIWSALPEADGYNAGNRNNITPDIYCTDSNGFLGELDAQISGNRQPNTTGSGNAKCK